MRLLNESSILAADLKGIRAFLVKKFHLHCAAVVLLTSEPDPQAPGAAFMTADAFPNGGWEAYYPERHFIRVYVPTLERPYPVEQQQNITGAPHVRLNAWHEELVHVLAHELQHVTQYCDPKLNVEDVVRDREGKFELDAETTAWKTTQEWQKKVERARQPAW